MIFRQSNKNKYYFRILLEFPELWFYLYPPNLLKLEAIIKMPTIGEIISKKNRVLDHHTTFILTLLTIFNGSHEKLSTCSSEKITGDE
jgi:hypothetical protein